MLATNLVRDVRLQVQAGAQEDEKMRISAACVDDENYANMGETRFIVEYNPKPVRFQLSLPKESCWDTVQNSLLEGCGLVPSETIRITYADDEDERVQLSSELEMQEALRVAEKKGNVLQIQVTEAPVAVTQRQLRGSYREKESGEFVFVGAASDNNNDDDDQPSTSGPAAAVGASGGDRGNSTTPPPWFVEFVRALRNELKDEVTAEVFKRLDERKVDKFDAAPESWTAISDVYPELATCANCLSRIQGARYRCWTCPNYELCEVCESLPSVHDSTHPMLKIRKPVGAQQQGSRRKRCNGSAFRPMRSPNRLSTMIEMKQEMKMQRLMKKLEKYNLRDTGIYRTQTAGPENYLNAVDLFDSEFVCDDTIPDWTHVQPGTRFTKRWKVRNSGAKTWDKGVLLKYCWGTLGLMPNDTDIEAPPLPPNSVGSLEVQFCAPHEPGLYQTHWRMFGPQGYFGHRLWCNVVVDPAQTLEPKQKHRSSLKVVQGVDEDMVQESMLKTEVLSAELKATLASQTATPFNTPAAMTPRKSPEPEEDEDSTEGGISKVSLLDMPIPQDAEESASVQSLSSIDTVEDDFEVVPLPSCFDLNIPFNLPEPATLLEPSVTDAQSSAPSCEVLNLTPEPNCSPCAALYNHSPHETDNEGYRQSDSGAAESDSSNSEDSVTPPKPRNVDEEHPQQSDKGHQVDGERKPAFSTRKIYKVEGVGDALPEALVNGALSAAATVYNTAKTVFSGIQPITDMEQLSSQRWSPPSSMLRPHDKLLEMGFRNQQLNSVLLKKHSGNIQKVIEELLLAENDSFTSGGMEGPPTARPFMFSFD